MQHLSLSNIVFLYKEYTSAILNKYLCYIPPLSRKEDSLLICGLKFGRQDIKESEASHLWR